MGHWSYLAVMAFIFLGTAWLEWGLRTRVYRRWRRLLLTLVPVVAVFLLWDAYAIAQGHWWFDEALITGIRLPGDIPVDELVFFVMVPIASVLTLEAVRSATGLRVGDEGGPDGPRGTDLVDAEGDPS
jgi:lycopene cyclase domain-containing protein